MSLSPEPDVHLDMATQHAEVDAYALPLPSPPDTAQDAEGAEMAADEQALLPDVTGVPLSLSQSLPSEEPTLVRHSSVAISFTNSVRRKEPDSAESKTASGGRRWRRRGHLRAPLSRRLHEALVAPLVSGWGPIEAHCDRAERSASDDKDEGIPALKVSTTELFYDLVFVALAIELSSLFAADPSLQRAGQCFLFFATLWLTWLHTNLLITRCAGGRTWEGKRVVSSGCVYVG